MAIRERLRADPLLFAHVCWPEEMETASAPYQAQIMRPPQNDLREAITTFRGGAKTSLAQKRLAHGLAFRKPWARFGLYISASKDLATEKLDNIRDSLECDAVRRLFGEPFPRGHHASDELLTNWGQRVIALGVGAKFRGFLWHGSRPTFAILDDIEAGREETSAADRQKAIVWYQRKLSYAMAPGGVIIAIGNKVHDDGLMAFLLKNPRWQRLIVPAVNRWPDRADLWEECRRIFCRLEDENRGDRARTFFGLNRTAMTAGGDLTWPARLDWLTDIYVPRWSDGEGAFLAEMQCDSTRTGIGCIRPDALCWEEWRAATLVGDDGWKVTRLDMRTLGFLDPAGGTGGGDYSAIACIGVDQVGYKHVLDASLSRDREPSRQVSDWWDMAERWGWTWGGVESDQYKAIERALREEQDRRRQAGRHWQTTILPITQREKKERRLAGLEPPISNKWLRFVRGLPEQLMTQLYAVPNGSHDDGPDALEGALQVARKVGI